MAKRKMKEGKCLICDERKMLNFEHVPPQSAFNKNTRYVETSFLDYMTSNEPIDRKLKGKIEQGGIGYYSFCESCNGFLGTEYVRSFKMWTHVGAEILTRGNYDIYEYSVHKQNPNKILKQIISMFVAINSHTFVERFPELLVFIKDPLSTILPEKFRVFTYLNERSQNRHLPLSFIGSFGTSEMIQCCEITFPPFGYVLIIDSNLSEKNYLAEITHFKDFDPKNEITLNLQLAKLETHLPIHMDYRTKAEIQQTIDSYQKFDSEI